MSKTTVTFDINTLIVERLRRVSEAKNLSPNFLAGVAFSNLLDELDDLDNDLAAVPAAAAGPGTDGGTT